MSSAPKRFLIQSQSTTMAKPDDTILNITHCQTYSKAVICFFIVICPSVNYFAIVFKDATETKARIVYLYSGLEHWARARNTPRTGPTFCFAEHHTIHESVFIGIHLIVNTRSTLSAGFVSGLSNGLQTQTTLNIGDILQSVWLLFKSSAMFRSAKSWPARWHSSWSVL